MQSIPCRLVQQMRVMDSMFHVKLPSGRAFKRQRPMPWVDRENEEWAVWACPLGCVVVRPMGSCELNDRQTAVLLARICDATVNACRLHGGVSVVARLLIARKERELAPIALASAQREHTLRRDALIRVRSRGHADGQRRRAGSEPSEREKSAPTPKSMPCMFHVKHRHSIRAIDRPSATDVLIDANLGHDACHHDVARTATTSFHPIHVSRETMLGPETSEPCRAPPIPRETWRLHPDTHARRSRHRACLRLGLPSPARSHRKITCSALLITALSWRPSSCSC